MRSAKDITLDHAGIEALRQSSPLTRLFDELGSDKGTMIDGHLYSLAYEALIPQDADHLLEIGIGTAYGFNGRCGSIRAWLQWLTHGTVWGFDILPAPADLLAQPRFKFLQGNAGKQDDLDRLAAAIPQVAAVIDDGSHFSVHQLMSFQALWPKVKSGGIYVIEDVYIPWHKFEWLRDIKEREWGAGEPPDTRTVLSKHPQFTGYIGREDRAMLFTKP